MVKALEPNALPSLEWLDIQDCNIGPEGAAALAEAIRQGCMPRLETLWCHNNSLGDAEVADLAKVSGEYP